jgi:hypothetical protein
MADGSRGGRHAASAAADRTRPEHLKTRRLDGELYWHASAAADPGHAGASEDFGSVSNSRAPIPGGPGSWTRLVERFGRETMRFASPRRKFWDRFEVQTAKADKSSAFLKLELYPTIPSKLHIHFNTDENKRVGIFRSGKRTDQH